ncbi:MAG: permease, partial [Caldimicrobium sp.]
TVLPLFASLYLQSAGLGPATTFLYSGPAINILAIVLTGKVLGAKIGLARAVGSITMGILIGIIMHFLFKQSEKKRLESLIATSMEKSISFSQSLLLLFTLVLILIIATSNLMLKWAILYALFILLLWQLYKFFNASLKAIFISLILVTLLGILSPYKEIPFIGGTLTLSYLINFKKGVLQEWFDNSYILAKQIFPLLFIGVFISGFFLGGVTGEGYIPKIYIEKILGGVGFLTHLLAAFITALMYFATLTEVPIIQGLMAQGVKAGPALSMLLAGPAVSLPSLLVLKVIIGPKKTITYAILVILISALYGFLYQMIFG